MRLSERDYEAVLRIIAVAGSASRGIGLTTDMLTLIQDLFPAADMVASFEGPPWDRAQRRVVVVGSHVAWSPAERVLHDQLRSESPLGPTPEMAGRAWRTTDRVAMRVFRRTDLYNLLARPHRIEFSMDFWATGRDGVLRGLGLDASRRDFSDRDRDVLTVLGGHLSTVLGGSDPRLPVRASRIGLTNREAEILAWVAGGETNRQIARRLSLSELTVRKHLENAFLRLGVHSRAAAVAAAYEAALVRAPSRSRVA